MWKYVSEMNVDKLSENVRNFQMADERTISLKPRKIQETSLKIVTNKPNANGVAEYGPLSSSHATMGLPNAITSGPENYLKKRTGIRLARPIIMANEKTRQCSLSSRRPVCPSSRSCLPKRQLPINVDNKYYIRRNIIDVTKTSAATRKMEFAIQDTRDGHRQILEDSGLQLKYVFKKDYGQVPTYLTENRRYRSISSAEDEEKIPHDDQCRNERRIGKIIPEQEKQMLIKGLKENLKLTEKEYSLLPVITDTLSRRRRRQTLEDQIKYLERDIKTLEIVNQPIMVMNDDDQTED